MRNKDANIPRGEYWEGAKIYMSKSSSLLLHCHFETACRRPQDESKRLVLHSKLVISKDLIKWGCRYFVTVEIEMKSQSSSVLWTFSDSSSRLSLLGTCVLRDNPISLQDYIITKSLIQLTVTCFWDNTSDNNVSCWLCQIVMFLYFFEH